MRPMVPLTTLVVGHPQLLSLRVHPFPKCNGEISPPFSSPDSLQVSSPQWLWLFLIHIRAGVEAHWSTAGLHSVVLETSVTQGSPWALQSPCLNCARCAQYTHVSVTFNDFWGGGKRRKKKGQTIKPSCKFVVYDFLCFLQVVWNIHIFKFK